MCCVLAQHTAMRCLVVCVRMSPSGTFAAGAGGGWVGGGGNNGGGSDGEWEGGGSYERDPKIENCGTRT